MIKSTKISRKGRGIISQYISLVVLFIATNHPANQASLFAFGSIQKRQRARSNGIQPRSKVFGRIHDKKPLPTVDSLEEARSVETLRGGSETELPSIGVWPCFDPLDKDLIRIAVPVILNFAIGPLVGAVDLFWVNQMSNPLAVAGQAAANQVFSSVFWLVSFLPSVTAILVSKYYATGDTEGLQDPICQAILIAIVIAFFGTISVFFNADKVLSMVLKEGHPAFEYARPYIRIRAFAILPSLLSFVGFAAFRGILDTVTPVKISLFTNVVHIILDPILIFTASMGVPGAALATLVAEYLSSVIFLLIMAKRKMIGVRKIFSLPSWTKLKLLLQGGAALQLRSLALNLAFMAVSRVTQSIDQTGVAASAHALAIQTFQVGGIVLLALSYVAQTVVPNQMVEKFNPETGRTEGGVRAAKAVVNRLMSWGFLLGALLGSLQIFMLPFIHKATPMVEVRDAASLPSYLASVFQIFNGMVFIGEGVMIGCGSFLQLSLSTVVATVGCLWALRAFPPRFGLTGVWFGFGVFNTIRLVGVWLHQTQSGPIAPKHMEREEQRRQAEKEAAQADDET